MIADVLDFFIYVFRHWWATVLFVYAFMSVYCFLVYAQDKVAAKSKGWRISEEKLHTLELLGGWPGALLAQRVFKHKRSKASFQSGFQNMIILNIIAVFFFCYGKITGDWRLIEFRTFFFGNFVRGVLTVLVALAIFAALCWVTYILVNPRYKGKRGENRVEKKLCSGLPVGSRLLHDIYLPLTDGTTTQIDQIIVNVYGIFVIEVKNYSGWIFGDARHSRWTQTIYKKKNTFQNPLFQNYAHICALSDRLGIPKEYFHNVVVFAGKGEFKTQMPPNVVKLEELTGYINSFTTPLIKEKQLFEIADAILAWQGTVSKEQRAAHVQNLRTRHR